MTDFKVGDRVISPYGPGTVVKIVVPGSAMVMHDNWFGGHNAGTEWEAGELTGNRCWNFDNAKLAKEAAN